MEIEAYLSFQMTPEERTEMNQTGGTQKPDFIVPVFGMHLGSVQFLGTAFFVNRNTLITANHVLTTKDSKTKKTKLRKQLKIKVGDVEGADTDGFVTPIDVESFPELDVAILKIAQSYEFKEKVKLVSNITWQDIDQLLDKGLYVAGLPSNCFDTARPRISSPHGELPLDPDTRVTSITAIDRLKSGFSGGPAMIIFDHTCFVIGIAIEGETTDSKITCQLPIGAFEKQLAIEASVLSIRIKEFVPNVKLSREAVPKPVLSNVFVGHDRQLQLLDSFWKDEDTTIVQIVAPGGVGKSTLAWRWIRQHLSHKFRFKDCPQLFEWCFYSNGKHDYQTDSGRFLQSALTHFECDAQQTAEQDHQATESEGWFAAERIANAFIDNGGVMVLDGVEPLQELPTAERQSGLVTDNGLSYFLSILKRNAHVKDRECPNRLLIITTRWRIADLDELDLPGSGGKRIDLKTLSDEQGKNLLKSFHLGAEKEKCLNFGDDTDMEGEVAAKILKEISSDVNGHPLAIILLGSLLVTKFSGNVERYGEIRGKIIDASEDDLISGSNELENFNVHRCARRVIRLYLQNLKRSSKSLEIACRQVLYQLGLFDKPARISLLRKLQDGSPIQGVTDLADGISFDNAISHLEYLHFVTVDNGFLGKNVTAHPLIREFFSIQFQNENPTGWTEAHSRLYDCVNGPNDPITREDLEPWFEKMVHGCRANRHQSALHDVFERKVLRGDKWSPAPVRGAFGSVLSVLSHFFKPGKHFDFVTTFSNTEDQLVVLKHMGDCISPTKGYSANETSKCYSLGIEISGGAIEFAKQNFSFRAGYARYLMGAGLCPKTVDAYQELLELAKKIQNPTLISAAQTGLSIAYLNSGMFEEAIYAADACLELRKGCTIEEGRQNANQLIVELVTSSLLWKGVATWHLGQATEAKNLVNEAIERAREVGHPHTLAVALCFAGFVYRFCSDVEKTMKIGEELISFSQLHGYYFWRAAAFTLTGWAISNKQDATVAEIVRGNALIEQGVEGWMAGGCNVQTPYWRSIIAENLIKLGEHKNAYDLLTVLEADASCEERHEKYWLPELTRLKIKAQISLGHPAKDFIPLLEKTIEFATKAKARMLLVRLFTDLGNIYLEFDKSTSCRKKLDGVKDRLKDVLAQIDGGNCPHIANGNEMLVSLDSD